MTVELLQTLSLAAFIAPGVLLLISIALFFLLDVPKIYGDISGRTAKKAIEEIRRQNEESGNKAYKPSAVNEARGKLTDKITPSGRLESPKTGIPISVGTEKFETSTIAPKTNETTLLSDLGSETTVLEKINDDENANTTMLFREEKNKSSKGNSKFTVETELSFSATSEIIE